MTTLYLVLIALFAPSMFVVTFSLIALWSRKWKAKQRDREREREIFHYFARAARTQKVRVLELGVELQWIALVRMGHSCDKSIVLLEPAARSRVQEEVEELTRVSRDLARRGLLRPYLTEFTVKGKKVSLKSPDSLVCLTSAGERVVNRINAEIMN